MRRGLTFVLKQKKYFSLFSTKMETRVGRKRFGSVQKWVSSDAERSSVAEGDCTQWHRGSILASHSVFDLLRIG